MYQVHRLKSYFMLFYIFGVSSYTPSKKFNQKKQIPFKILKFLPKVVHISYIVFALLRLAYRFLYSPTFIVEYILVVTFTLPLIAILIDDVSSVPKIRKMLFLLFDTFHFLNNTLRVPVDLKTFEQNFRLKLFFSIVLNIFLFMIMMISKFFGILYVWSVIVTIHKLFALFQVIFFVEFSNFLLFCLNQELNRLQYGCHNLLIISHIESSVITLRNIKKIHFKMSKVNKLVTSRFGYFMTAMLLEFIVMPCIDIFYIFVLLSESIGSYTLGNYIIFQIWFLCCRNVLFQCK